MNCDAVRRLVDASLDGELDLVHEVELEAHLKECADCSMLYAAHRQWRTDLERKDLYYPAPAGLGERVRVALAASSDEAAPRGRRRRFSLAWQGWPALGVAAAIVFFAVVGLLMLRARPSPPDRLLDDMVAAHIRSLLPGHLADVPSFDQHTVKPWFAGRVDFSPPVTDFSARGFPLVGGRLD
ncbi:MAG: anti-sigma factor family protein, partial [Bacteroidales bacterium]